MPGDEKANQEEGEMLNIVIPMAGLGSRFTNAGYKLPKPLIPVHGMPMIRLVIENLRPRATRHRFIVILQRVVAQEHELARQLVDWCGSDTELVLLDGLTDGAARTVLQAKPHIDNDEPLMIANCDQFVDTDIEAYLAQIEARNLDGLIMTMSANDPKWSFAGLGPDGLVTRVVEKQVISDEATVGIYNFRKGSDFVRAAESMIEQRLTVNGEYYVAPAYNELIARGGRVGCVNVGSEGNGMYGLGIPADLEHFLALPISRVAAGVSP